jgi:hypothetical protein
MPLIYWLETSPGSSYAPGFNFPQIRSTSSQGRDRLHPPRINSYREFDEHGFDQVPTATNWCPGYLYKDKGIKSNDVNFPLTVAHCRQTIAPGRLKGFMMTTWTKTLPENFETISHAIDLVAQSMII